MFFRKKKNQTSSIKIQNKQIEPILRRYIRYIPDSKKNKFADDLHALYSVVLNEAMETITKLATITAQNDELEVLEEKKD